MPVSQLEEKLHEIIETAEKEKLEAIYTLLEAGGGKEEEYAVEDIEMIYLRRNNYNAGKEPILSTEDFVRYVKNNAL